MEKRTKRWGDRPDAYWIRNLDGLHAIMPHLMNKRTDAEVYVNMEFDVTEALRYIEEKNRGEDEYRPPCSTVSSWPLPKPYICGRI